MRRNIFTIVSILVVAVLAITVIAQDQTGTTPGATGRGGRAGGLGAGAAAGGGTRAGRGGITANQRQQAITAIEEQLMILKGNTLQREHNQEMARLQAIADMAVQENATATARLIRSLIAEKQLAYQDTIERLGITFGAGAQQDTVSSDTEDQAATGQMGGRGMMAGIGATSVDDPQGAKLETVAPSGRASRFGLQAGDIVISINGQEVENAASFEELMGSVARGSAVSIQVIRDGQEITVGREAMTFGVPQDDTQSGTDGTTRGRGGRQGGAGNQQQNPTGQRMI